ncbi:oplophorus-luciferin 2-monooxygenase non-catalytic subunit-like isoform X2 [Portunus trituberculatus]|uniref:oplophorus-luciferin 2-monooxygenase non-catalytic subunit-like isoform X2 n=1 Tax=Portunus trituberculatus TaxID=210409 RepID=UPI001E1CD007|nr:oplophorus-luciferin 2-monooxygenase non-catalytic subunit-like isoform X2 [Portunus trituberculatus]
MNSKCIYMVMMAVLRLMLTSAQSCPFHMDIAPCLCTEIGPSPELDMDCSHVVDIDQLMRVFQADFPSTNYRRLSMTGTPDDPIPISFLPDGVFGSITFQEIVIQHAQINRVDDYAFLGSKDTLTMLTLIHSELTSFPTTILPLLSDFRELDLSYNHLVFIPDLRSSSLRSLTLAHNTQLNFSDRVFDEIDQIIDLNIAHCNMETIPPGMFLNMMNLSTVYLEYNKITHLDAASLHFTRTGKHTYLELLNNQITTLGEASWRPVFHAISEHGDGLVMLDGNPLDCGCSLAWLVTSSSFLSHLALGATCANGTAIHDLNPSAFDHNCGR